MTSIELDAFEPDSALLARAAKALAGVPRAAHTLPHVYPWAAPAFEPSPMSERPHPCGDELRLYVHIPYCRYRCSFCYFAVRVGADHAAMARYVSALERELEWIPEGKGLSQLFVGGGTPTALPPELVDRVLSAVFEHAPPHESKANVHTVETSPETISTEHLDVLRRHGIGRVSMGVQSLDEDVLGAVHREQTTLGAIEACELLVDSGLIVNVDLIYGLPGQSGTGFLSDLEQLARLGVPSFTLYSLRVTERTSVRHLLGHDHLDLARLMSWRALVRQAAEQLGYTQTRWHTFKRLDTIAHGHERLPCFDRDMSGYQLGVGMSARSHLGHAVYRNHDVHDVYVDRIEAGQSPVEQIFPLTTDDLMTQFVARTLGDGQPLTRRLYEATFGRSIDADYGAVLDRLRNGGLLADDGETVSLTDDGGLLYDLVTLAFYPEGARSWLAERVGKATHFTLTAVPE